MSSAFCCFRLRMPRAATAATAEPADDSDGDGAAVRASGCATDARRPAVAQPSCRALSPDQRATLLGSDQASGRRNNYSRTMLQLFACLLMAGHAHGQASPEAQAVSLYPDPYCGNDNGKGGTVIVPTWRGGLSDGSRTCDAAHSHSTSTQCPPELVH